MSTRPGDSSPDCCADYCPFHYARVEVETVLQVNGMGPFDGVTIDPKDDPRKK